CLDHQVVVVLHEAKGEAAPPEPADHVAEDREEHSPVANVPVDRLTAIAASRDVVDRTRRLQSRDPSHALTVEPALSRGCRRACLDTKSAHVRDTAGARHHTPCETRSKDQGLTPAG